MDICKYLYERCGQELLMRTSEVSMFAFVSCGVYVCACVISRTQQIMLYLYARAYSLHERCMGAVSVQKRMSKCDCDRDRDCGSGPVMSHVYMSMCLRDLRTYK
jgi:hypothetical protein